MWCNELPVSSCSQVASIQGAAFTFSLPPFSPSSTPFPSSPALGVSTSDLPHSSFTSPLFCLCCSSPAKLLPGLGAALPFPLLLIYLPAGSWGVLSWTKNLSWARQLRPSESSERHLMIKYLIKDEMIPKPKRESHTSYLI